MKKTFLSYSLGIVMGIMLLGTGAFADCLDFGKANVCVNISNIGPETYKVSSSIQRAIIPEITFLSCEVMGPDGVMRNIGACDGNFKYTANGIYTLTFYIKLDNEYKTMKMIYNFTGGITSVPPTPSYVNPNPIVVPPIGTNFYLTTTQKSDLHGVYNMRPQVGTILKTKFPNLSGHLARQESFAKYYLDLGKLLNYDVTGPRRSYNDAYNGLISFAQYTAQVRGTAYTGPINTGVATTGVDLIIENLQLDAAYTGPKVGDNYSYFLITLKNSGGTNWQYSNSISQFKIQCNLSGSVIVDLIYSSGTIVLNAGASLIIPARSTLTPSFTQTAGLKTLRCVADNDNFVSEYSESNNDKTLIFTVN